MPISEPASSFNIDAATDGMRHVVAVDVAPNVELCFAQAWEFLTGQEMRFTETDGDYKIAGPAKHFLVSFQPAEKLWCAGAALSLSCQLPDYPINNGCEICNIFSGCVTRLFAKREEFSVSLPACVPSEDIDSILEAASFVRCYSNPEGSVRLLAFESDHLIQFHAFCCEQQP